MGFFMVGSIVLICLAFVVAAVIRGTVLSRPYDEWVEEERKRRGKRKRTR